MARARSKEEQEQAVQDKAEEQTSTEGGGIEYIDQGSWTLEIDRRGPMEVKRHLPKAHSDVPVPENVAQQVREHAEGDPSIPDEDVDLIVPPVAGEDD